MLLCRSPLLKYHKFNNHLDFLPAAPPPPLNRFLSHLSLEFSNHVQAAPFRVSVHFGPMFQIGYEIEAACGFLPPGPACK